MLAFGLSSVGFKSLPFTTSDRGVRLSPNTELSWALLYLRLRALETI